MVFIARRTDLGSLRPRVGKVLRRDEVHEFREACAIVGAARAQSEALLAGATAVLEEARQEGFREGAEQARASHAELIVETLALRARLLSSSEEQLVGLLLACLHEMCVTIEGPGKVRAAVAGALKALCNCHHAELRVHPSDLDAAREAVADASARFPTIEFIKVESDSRLQRGHCAITSDVGTAETCLDAQLGAIARAFERALIDGSHDSGSGQ